MAGSAAIQSMHSETSTSASLPVATKWLNDRPRSVAMACMYAPSAPLWLTMPMLPGGGMPLSSEVMNVV